MIIAFDVDGTLYDSDDQPRWDVLALLQTFEKYANIIVWSGSGADYARIKGQRLYLPSSVTYLAKGQNYNRVIDMTIDDQDCILGTVNLKV